MSKPKVTKKTKTTTKPKAASKAKATSKTPAASKTKAKTKKATSKAKTATKEAPKPTGKPKMIKEYDKLSPALVAQVKMHYPYGFEKKLIFFKNRKGKLVSALPFEGEKFFYMVKMTKELAQKIVQGDEDFDGNGRLKDSAVVELKKIVEAAAIEAEKAEKAAAAEAAAETTPE